MTEWASKCRKIGRKPTPDLTRRPQHLFHVKAGTCVREKGGDQQDSVVVCCIDCIRTSICRTMGCTVNDWCPATAHSNTMSRVLFKRQDFKDAMPTNTSREAHVDHWWLVIASCTCLRPAICKFSQDKTGKQKVRTHQYHTNLTEYGWHDPPYTPKFSACCRKSSLRQLYLVNGLFRENRPCPLVRRSARHRYAIPLAQIWVHRNARERCSEGPSQRQRYPSPYGPFTLALCPERGKAMGSLWMPWVEIP